MVWEIRATKIDGFCSRFFVTREIYHWISCRILCRVHKSHTLVHKQMCASILHTCVEFTISVELLSGLSVISWHSPPLHCLEYKMFFIILKYNHVFMLLWALRIKWNCHLMTVTTASVNFYTYLYLTSILKSNYKCRNLLVFQSCVKNYFIYRYTNLMLFHYTVNW